jgi:mannose-6-phosphate isomerase-like protein (cupin superfamily)
MSNDDDAEDFALGALRGAQRDVVSRKRLYYKDLDSRIGALEGLLSALTPAAVGQVPGDRLWQQVCSVLTQQQCEDADGSFAYFGGTWDHHGSGIETKLLWSDKVLLIRCEPGASEDCHPQPEDEDEHIIVIAGDLVIGGRQLGAGDYVQIPAGVVHPPMHTLTGCLIFTEYQLTQAS